MEQVTRWGIILAALLIALSGAPVAAQMACGMRAEMVTTLIDKYGEHRVGAGLTGPTAIFEVWANCDTGTWTILKTMPTGWACVMAVGEVWRADECEKGKPI